MLGLVGNQTLQGIILHGSGNHDIAEVLRVRREDETAAVLKTVIPLAEQDRQIIDEDELIKGAVGEIDPDAVQIYDSAAFSCEGLFILLYEDGGDIHIRRRPDSDKRRQRRRFRRLSKGACRQAEHQCQQKQNGYRFFHMHTPAILHSVRSPMSTRV